MALIKSRRSFFIIGVTFQLSWIFTQGYVSPLHVHKKSWVGGKLNKSPLLQMAKDKQDGSGEERPKIRDKMKKFAKTIIVKPMTTVAPKAIAELLTDATTGAVDMAWGTIDDLKKGGSIRSSAAMSRILEKEAEMQGDTAEALDSIAL